MYTSGLWPVTALLHKQYTLVVLLLPKVNSCITNSSVEGDSSHIFYESIVMVMVGLPIDYSRQHSIPEYHFRQLIFPYFYLFCN